MYIYIKIHVIISTFFPSSIISKIITERGGGGKDKSNVAIVDKNVAQGAGTST